MVVRPRPDGRLPARAPSTSTASRPSSSAMIAHCELMGDRVAILDPPPGLNAQQVKDWRVDKAGYDSKYAALYWPWIKVFDPATGREHPRAAVAATWPASGAATTTPAACTRRRPTRSSAAPSTSSCNITKGEHDLLNPVGINCIRAFPGRGIRVWGARTLSSDPAWRYLNVRRLFNYLEESILNGTQWVVFEPNDRRLWAKIRRTHRAPSWSNEWRKGALFGHDAGRGVLRQVRRRDQPARGDRRRPGHLRDRRRAGQAGRVRHLPPVPVLRRHQPRRRVSRHRPDHSDRICHTTIGKDPPWHSPTSTLRSATRSAARSTA